MPDMFESLLQMHRLAREVEASLERNDLASLCFAAARLEPALEACYMARELNEYTDAALPFLAETCILLDRCAGRLQQEMQQTSLRLRSIRKGRRALAASAKRNPIMRRRLDRKI